MPQERINDKFTLFLAHEGRNFQQDGTFRLLFDQERKGGVANQTDKSVNMHLKICVEKKSKIKEQ